MISVEDKALMEESKGCTSCLQWHKHCKAECCRMIFLDTGVQELNTGGRFIFRTLPAKPTYDEIQYFKIHGVPYVRGKFKFSKHNIVKFPKGYVYLKDCMYLKDYLCTAPKGEKPKQCTDLTMENLRANNTYTGTCSSTALTSHCLFKYKLMEEQNNAKEKIEERKDSEEDQY